MPMVTVYNVHGMTHKQIVDSLETVSNIRVMNVATVQGTAKIYYIEIEKEDEAVTKEFEDDTPSEFWDLYD